jgi:hypothetical protein
LTRGPVTLLACWDADRLDLVRVGIRPQTHLLCTEAARNNRILEWAYGRSLLSTGVAVPPFPWWVTVEGMLGLLPPSHLEEGRYRQELSCTGLADFLTGRPGWARLALSGF